ncbi:hypothetical protein T440DRAFT_507477 [Plenodomus tracheiphilus IPT5]|uniref:CCHC-type domain-containing protein n=1 Tax=Plenodomus tracheiphilus IPT5 TaxID=1408161 RepID=A0A6A7B8W4_9PLEO|nr:hypothetical protein T440DRAFT_507477 [Plenodomus tracheiphilus IPT5]
MGEPPDKWLGSAFYHPKTLIPREQLTRLYAKCGVKNTHTRCLGCLKDADAERRGSWLDCQEHCGCCSCHPGVNYKVKHVGSICPQMVMTYDQFFTREFFQDRAEVGAAPGSDEFVRQYNRVRVSRPKKVAPRGVARGRGRVEEQGFVRLLEKYMSREDTRSRKRNSSPSPSSIKNRSKRSRTACHKCGKEGHKAYDSQDFACRICDVHGHMVKDCPNVEDTQRRNAAVQEVTMSVSEFIQLRNELAGLRERVGVLSSEHEALQSKVSKLERLTAPLRQFGERTLDSGRPSSRSSVAGYAGSARGPIVVRDDEVGRIDGANGHWGPGL